MDLYQAGYFRLGKQGIGSGWDIVTPSDGMSDFAIDGFKGIAASLIKLEESIAQPMPTEAVGLFRYNNKFNTFIYFTHVNYAAHGEDDRGVAYVHTYCFNLKDYYKLCVQPEMLFGIQPDTFDMEYRAEIMAYPVEHQFSYSKMDYNELLNKYNFSDEQYKNLILGVICAIEGYSNPMCIKYSKSLSNYSDIYKDIMYLIMSGLPYHLRQKVLSFSYKGMHTHTTVYFSDIAEGNNYFDLDSGEAFCDSLALKRYHFIKIYNTTSDNEKRDTWFQSIANFINSAYKNPFKNADCEMVEAGFQGQIKKNEVGGIPPEIVLDLLDTFLKYDITNSNEAADYIAELLEVAYNNNLEVTERIAIKKINELYEKFTLKRLHSQIAQTFTREVLVCGKHGNREKGFDILWNLKKEKPALYDLVCEYLKEINYSFYNDYLINKFLPYEIINLDRAEKYLRENKNCFILDDTYQALLKQMQKIIDDEMKKATSFNGLLSFVKRISEVSDFKGILNYSCYALWNNFDIKWFNIGDVDNYKLCQVQKISRFEENPCPNAQKVNGLISVVEDVLEYSQIAELYKFIFTDDTLNNKEFKKTILMDIKKNFNSDMNIRDKAKDTYIDISLLLNYDIKKEQFALVDWINEITNDNDSFMEESIQHSSLLQSDKIREMVIKSIKSTVKNKKKSGYNNLNSNAKKAFNELQNYLCGELNDNKDAEQLFNYTLHREIIGFFALFTFIICNLSLSKYGSNGSYISLVLAVFFIVPLFALISYILFEIRDNKLTVLLSNLGIENSKNMQCYVYVAIVALAVVIAVLSIDSFLIKAVCSMIFLDAAAVSVFVYGITLKE